LLAAAACLAFRAFLAVFLKMVFRKGTSQVKIKLFSDKRLEEVKRKERKEKRRNGEAQDSNREINPPTNPLVVR
jgi:hypothetical protein